MVIRWKHDYENQRENNSVPEKAAEKKHFANARLDGETRQQLADRSQLIGHVEGTDFYELNRSWTEHDAATVQRC